MTAIDKTKDVLKQLSPQQTLQQLIEKSAKEFKQALPLHMRPERLVRIGLTCIRLNPELLQCTPASFVGALLVSAQLGLEPVAGRAYILPFFNSKTGRKDAQFMVGYRGLADLFYRHDKAVQLAWGVVHKNDEFDYEYGTQARLRHRPIMSDRGEVVGYYVIAEVQGGAKPFMYMSKIDCIEHGKRHSKTFDQKTKQFYSRSPWATDPDAMCLKTVLIQLSKLLPLSIELQKAISVDETSREYREGIDDALDLRNTASWGEDKIDPLPSVESPATGLQTLNNDTPNGISRNTITDQQIHAIEELALKRYNRAWPKEIVNRIGNQFGIEQLIQLTTEQAKDLIRDLSKEATNG